MQLLSGYSINNNPIYPYYVSNEITFYIDMIEYSLVNKITLSLSGIESSNVQGNNIITYLNNQ